MADNESRIWCPEDGIEGLKVAGGVERLVANGRVPAFIEVRVGEVNSSIPQTYILIPPLGTKFGDKVERGLDGGTAKFYSPEGVLRGNETSLLVDRQEGNLLQKRVDDALRPKKKILGAFLEYIRTK